MQIFFPKEKESENRVSILPETVKKLVELGISVEVEASLGKTVHVSDDLYASSGASISNDRNSSLFSLITSLDLWPNPQDLGSELRFQKALNGVALSESKW